MSHSFHCSVEDEEHGSHDFDLEVVRDCTGTTACGEAVHPPHTIPVVVHMWCPGVCLCGATYRGLHGPGEHK